MVVAAAMAEEWMADLRGVRRVAHSTACSLQILAFLPPRAQPRLSAPSADDVNDGGDQDHRGRCAERKPAGHHGESQAEAPQTMLVVLHHVVPSFAVLALATSATAAFSAARAGGPHS